MRKYNLKAIHNTNAQVMTLGTAVEDQCESTIWKQFTTSVEVGKIGVVLLKTNAKVQFESNSQPPFSRSDAWTCCWRPMRKYNLKAIHNVVAPDAPVVTAVEDQCESTIWKQFTTEAFRKSNGFLLLKTNAKVQFESNSQRILIPVPHPKRCWRPMRKYNLKAIHNCTVTVPVEKSAVEDQCESTIWKQFTTGL